MKMVFFPVRKEGLVHHEEDVLGHPAREHVQAQQVLIRVLGIKLGEYLLDDGCFEGLQVDEVRCPAGHCKGRRHHGNIRNMR